MNSRIYVEIAAVLSLLGLIVNAGFDLDNMYDMTTSTLFLLAFVGSWALRRWPYDHRGWVYGFLGAALLTAIVMEFGWATDEIGRQPWIVYNVLTVSQAANPSTALFVPGLVIVAFYLLLVPVTFYFMVRVFNGQSLAVDLEETPGAKDVNY